MSLQLKPITEEDSHSCPHCGSNDVFQSNLCDVQVDARDLITSITISEFCETCKKTFSISYSLTPISLFYNPYALPLLE
jgi:hypothetical protein